ncbi:hypothetical protein JCM21900_001475 [Sporobolomyces salmonicolor]
MPRSPSPVRGRSLSRSRSPSRSPTPSDTIRVGKLTKNVTSIHLEEIFDVYGKILDIDLPILKRLGTHKGTAWIRFASSAAAGKAAAYMDGGQVDGSFVTAVLEPPSPPRPAARAGAGEGYGREASPLPYDSPTLSAMAAAVDTSDKSSMPKSNDATDSARIGWAFLSQYYSYLNKDPARLHCFYTKRSTLIHSTEGEDATPCYGQQEIHAKIMSLAFEDCKVYISNVDSQSSAEGGIIVQVIGEMSNASGPWRKFAQTFFLAEQPNGYFVLNDICRYIKEEGDDDVAAAAHPAAAPAQPEPVAAADVPPASVESVLFNEVGASTPSYAVPQEEQQPIVSTAAAVDPSSFTFHNDDALLHPVTNGVAHPKPEAPKVEAAPAPEPVAVEELPAAPEAPAPEPVTRRQEETPAPLTEVPAAVETSAPTVPAPVPAVEPTQPAPAEAPQPSPSTSTAAPAPVPAPVAAPTPSAPAVPAPAPGPKSWASLAASNSTKWGSVSNASKGVSSAAPPAAEPTPAPAAAAAAVAAAAPAPTAAAAASTSAAPAQPPVQFSESVMAVTQPACFVKGVVEFVPEATLRHVLTTRFGPLKEVDIVRSKACAFIEFESLHSARRAIQASLRPSEGGEGAILFDVPTGEKARINVVERKPHSERPVPRPRGLGNVGAQQGRGQGEGKATRGDDGARGGRGGASGARGGRGGRGGAKAGSGAPAASK